MSSGSSRYDGRVVTSCVLFFIQLRQSSAAYGFRGKETDLCFRNQTLLLVGSCLGGRGLLAEIGQKQPLKGVYEARDDSVLSPDSPSG